MTKYFTIRFEDLSVEKQLEIEGVLTQMIEEDVKDMPEEERAIEIEKKLKIALGRIWAELGVSI